MIITTPAAIATATTPDSSYHDHSQPQSSPTTEPQSLTPPTTPTQTYEARPPTAHTQLWNEHRFYCP